MPISTKVSGVTRAILWAALLLALGEALQATPIHFAENFSISDQDGYRLVTVQSQDSPGSKTYRYALIPKTGSPESAVPEDAQIIRTPVKRVVALETVYLGYMAELSVIDALIGAASEKYITNSDILDRLNTGSIHSLHGGQALDVERLLLLQPDLILTSMSTDPALNVSTQLSRTGLPVVFTAGYREDSPLARAEWIKFIAAFTGKEAEANVLFEALVQRYQSLKASVQEQKKAIAPTVFCDAPYSGSWYVPGGNSYTAQLIADAGGRYVWDNNQSRASIPLDTERVFHKAANADFWLNPGSARSLSALTKMDSRFSLFQAFQKQQVFNNTRLVTASGGNPIWESGVCRPDEVLADLIAIFHPDLLPGHVFTFYEKLK